MPRTSKKGSAPAPDSLPEGSTPPRKRSTRTSRARPPAEATQQAEDVQRQLRDLAGELEQMGRQLRDGRDELEALRAARAEVQRELADFRRQAAEAQQQFLREATAGPEHLRQEVAATEEQL